MGSTLRVGYRAGRLGEAQWVVLEDQLNRRNRDAQGAPVPIDPDEEVPGLERVFVNPLELALLNREVDIVVANLYEIDAVPAAGVKLASVTQRADAREALVTPLARPIKVLSPGTQVYVDSLRRARQLLHMRDVLMPVMTRLRPEEMLEVVRSEGDTAAIVALSDLMWMHEGPTAEGEPIVSDTISTDEMLPAPGQGSLGLLVREGDLASEREAQVFLERASHACALAERECARSLGCSVYSPVGTLAQLDEAGSLRLRAAVFGAGGDPVVRAAGTSAPENAKALGQAVAGELLRRGAEEILLDARREDI